MNQYLNSVLATVKAKNRGEDEFHQAVEEVLETLGPALEKHPEYIEAKIVERLVFDGDDIRRAKLMNLSISCDHRVVDGWDAASYVQALKKLIETPVLLFAD